MNYEFLMQQAISLAKNAAEHNDVPVGALVVNEQGEILGIGHNYREEKNDPTAHAEIVAIREAASKMNNWRMDGLTIIVTLEPCVMCAGAISQARFRRLVFGAWDKKAGAVGSVWDVVRDQRNIFKIEVIAGICEKQIINQISNFFEKLRNK